MYESTGKNRPPAAGHGAENARRNANNTAGRGATDQARRRAAVKRRRARRAKRVRCWLCVLASVGILAVLLICIFSAQPKGDGGRRAEPYPLKYVELIKENAAQQGVDPAYIAAVILAESSYDPLAVSPVNAQGLMQIMPDTGVWLAGKFDEEYTEGCLFDPATNIRYGSWYLGYLLRRYDGDMKCSTAAYHSGQGTVDGWLQDPACSSDGRTLEVIAGKNASSYVNRVLEYYEKYEQLYAELI